MRKREKSQTMGVIGISSEPSKFS